MYESYNEVFRQGESLSRTYDEIIKERYQIQRFINDNEYDEVIFIACGSSYWLSLSACMTLQERLKKKCSAVKSGDIVMNKDYYGKVFRNPLVIAPSRSGSTSETLMALDFFRTMYGCKVLSLVEYSNAPILSRSDMVLEFPWAKETSVCQTRSFSNLYMALVMVAAIVGEDEALIKDIKNYLEHFDSHSKHAENMINCINSNYPEFKTLVTLGNGKLYGVCIGGAYVNIEMAQLPSNYYGTLEFRHGPIVMAGAECLIFMFSGGNARELEESMAKEIRERAAKIAVICEEANFRNANYCFCLGRNAAPEIVGLFGAMVLQGFAHLKAILSDIDPDKPKGLVPWISI